MTENNLETFKKLVRKATFLESNEIIYFESIPNEKWKKIFEKNFGANLSFAQRVILNKFREIEDIDTAKVDREKIKIHNIDKATKMVTSSIDDKSPILFITDFDNDGSLAQAIINEYLKIDISAAKNMQVHYAQTVNGNSNRGFTVDLVDRIIEHRNINSDKKFLIITADNGINSLEEQQKIHAKYPMAEIVITDHHNPDEEMVIKENSKAIIFNPKFKPTDFFKNFNISGATTIGVLLRNILKHRYTKEQLEPFKKNFENISKISKVANLLDYVDTDPADKPEKDYVITKFLKLQPLLNINNSISKIITGEISTSTIKSIQEKIPNLDTELLYNEAKNIHIHNKVAKILLKIYSENLLTDVEKTNITVKKNADSNFISVDNIKISKEAVQDDEVLFTSKKISNEDHLYELILKELNEPANYLEEDVINPNYIEQLRPLIFGLSADDSKNTFMDALNNQMVSVFENIKTSEQKMAQELRRGEVVQKTKLEHSVIAYTDKNILTVFNRKFLNKVYNDENPGFSLTLDSLDKGKVSGSFRSLYNISDILKDKKLLEKQLNIKIETPGHQKAAGFIVKSLEPESNPILPDTIQKINEFINNSIAKIKENELASDNIHLLTDLSAIKLLDRINRVVHGNVSNFERITPLLKITTDTIWTDSFSTKQYSMEEIINTRKYGYITININFDKDTVIVPVELVRKIVKNDYKDYLSLGYMDGGVFMAEKVVFEKDAKKIIDLRNKDSKTQAIADVFEKDFKDKNIINLNREQIKDNPFFKYHDYGNLNFDLFENMVIGIIDSNHIDMLTVFDVEANGFANSKLMNIGAMNYFIDSKSGEHMPSEDFEKRLFATQRGDEYVLTNQQIKELKEVSLEEIKKMSDKVKKLLFVKPKKNVSTDFDNDSSNEFNNEISIDNKLNDISEIGNHYYYHSSMNNVANIKKAKIHFLSIKNYLINNTDDTVTYNRSISATMLAYLVKDIDFKVPQEMTNLTGITQQLLNKYGMPTDIVDKDFAKYYEGKQVLFGAHNTPYDARVLRANTPEIYKLLRNNQIYDSALFSREQKLAYDEVLVSNFENIDGISSSIYFYNNDFSEFNLTKFIKKNENGYYPDRTGNYLLSIEDNKYYIVNKTLHEIVQINATQEELLLSMKTGDIPNVSVKYGVEKLSEQWMIHALLLSDEKFNIQHVNLDENKYLLLQKFHDQLVFFQENYHFDASPEKNVINLINYYQQLGGFKLSTEEADLFNKEFIKDFLDANKTIQQKFSDAWMYKKVLSIKEPDSNDDITNDLVDLVQFQTTLPRDKVIIIYKEALAFKKKYKIDHIMQHEGHINGPWEHDNKGDIAFEDKLTLSLLAQRYYDPYNHSVKHAVKQFNLYSLRAREAFEKSDKLADDAAQDSYSVRQAQEFKRDSKTDMIFSLQKKEDALLNYEEEQVVIFKLGNDVLTPETNICAITKHGIKISREQLEEDSKKLSFIVVNEQLKYSLKNQSSHGKEAALCLLKENDIISIDIKKDLAKRYRYVQHSKKTLQIKKLLDTLIIISQKDNFKETKIIKNLPVHDIGTEGFNIVKSIFDKYVETANGIHDTKLKVDSVKQAYDYLDYKRNSTPETSLENAIANTSTQFNETKNINDNFEENIDEENKNKVKERNFLYDLTILRQKPIKNLFNKHMDLRLMNFFIDKNTELMKENPKHNSKKISI